MLRLRLSRGVTTALQSDTTQYLSESKTISNPTQRESLLTQQGRGCSRWAESSTAPKGPQTAEEQKWVCYTRDIP